MQKSKLFNVLPENSDFKIACFDISVSFWDSRSASFAWGDFGECTDIGVFDPQSSFYFTPFIYW